MRIGYQGLVGSNSEVAARQFAEKLGLTDAEFIPLVSSRGVVGELKRKALDYGVVAVKNTLGGTVVETFEAIKNEYLELVDTEILPIHHCMFKHPATPESGLKVVASHIQALKQTEVNRAKLFPGLAVKEVEDTAIAAKYLAEGVLGEDTAVLCRREAGELYNLDLIYENLEDSLNNYTEFRVFKLADTDYSNSAKPSFKERVSFELVNERGLGYLSKALMVFAIFVSFYVAKRFNMSSWETATLIGGYLSALFLLLTSNSLRNKVRYRSLIGYWKYYSLSDNSDKNDELQKFTTPRLVQIEEIDGELVLHGFICDRENVPLFESTRVMVSSLGKCRGQLVYWYANPQELNRGYSINGIAELNWVTKHPAAKVNKMSGYYLGKATKDTGAIEYLRISKEEYEAHRSNDFI